MRWVAGWMHLREVQHAPDEGHECVQHAHHVKNRKVDAVGAEGEDAALERDLFGEGEAHSDELVPPLGPDACEVRVEGEELSLCPPQVRSDAGRAAAGFPVRQGLVRELHLVGLVGARVLNILAEHVGDKRPDEKDVRLVLVRVSGREAHVVLTEGPLATGIELIQQFALLTAQALAARGTKHPLVRMRVDAKHKVGGHAIVQGNVIEREPPLPPLPADEVNHLPESLDLKDLPLLAHLERAKLADLVAPVRPGRLAFAGRGEALARPSRLAVTQAVEASEIKYDARLDSDIYTADSVQVGADVFLVGPGPLLCLLGGRSSDPHGCSCLEVAPITLAPGLLAAGGVVAPHCAGG